MPDPAWPAIAVLLLGVLCFACFTWGTIFHFVWITGGSAGAWGVSLLSWAAFMLFVWCVVTQPLAQPWPAACCLFVVCLLLWSWTLASTRATPPTLAFTGDEPVLLLDTGPYRWIRHPFYTAYMLFWIGAALAMARGLGWIAVLAIGATYWSAARHEEAKFARSGLASGYRAYLLQAGMFLPRVCKGRQP